MNKATFSARKFLSFYYITDRRENYDGKQSTPFNSALTMMLTNRFANCLKCITHSCNQYFSWSDNIFMNGTERYNHQNDQPRVYANKCTRRPQLLHARISSQFVKWSGHRNTASLFVDPLWCCCHPIREHEDSARGGVAGRGLLNARTYMCLILLLLYFRLWFANQDLNLGQLGNTILINQRSSGSLRVKFWVLIVGAIGDIFFRCLVYFLHSYGYRDGWGVEGESRLPLFRLRLSI